MSNKPLNPPSQVAGFTLIEALVTVLIMSVGMLGLAALQNTSIKFTYDSYLRTQSSLLAGDLFDRMRANPTVNYTDLSATTTTDCTTTACDPTTMMRYDMKVWKQQREAIFSSDTTVKITTSDPFEVYEIEFKWDSRTEDGDRGTGGEDERQTITYEARVK